MAAIRNCSDEPHTIKVVSPELKYGGGSSQAVLGD